MGSQATKTALCDTSKNYFATRKSQFRPKVTLLAKTPKQCFRWKVPITIEELKSSDQRTVLESWSSGIETLHSEQAVCSVRYLVAYSKTLLLGKILKIFENKHDKGEEKIMLHYF